MVDKDKHLQTGEDTEDTGSTFTSHQDETLTQSTISEVDPNWYLVYFNGSLYKETPRFLVEGG